jgi:adenylate cyclase
VLATFESPVEAVRCALAVQRAVAARNARIARHQRLRFRVGINIGDVVVSAGDILGDGVNVASRLEGLAEPGGICLSGAAHDLVAGKVDAETRDLGEQSLRNIPRPIRVYALPSFEESIAEPEPEPPPAPKVAPQRAPPQRPALQPQERDRRDDLRAPLRDDDRPDFIVYEKRRRLHVLGVSILIAAAISGVALYLVLARTGSLQSQQQPAPQQTAPVQQQPQQAINVPPLPSLQQPQQQQPPAQAARPFSPEQVPFVTDQVRERLRTEYLPGRDHKAVVLSRSGASAWFLQGQLSDEEAARHATASCRQNAPEPCELYALGNRVVWEHAAPPMPPKPWLPPSGERVRSAFDLDRVPLAGPAMREALRADYLQDTPTKAVAIARTGTIGFAKRRASEDEAVRAALEYCAATTGTACAVLAVNESFVQPIPSTVKVIGLFEPERSPLLDDAAKQRLRESYLPRGGWKAVALGNGKVGLAAGRPNEKDAIDQALADCKAQGGEECALHAISIFTVQGK